MPGQEKFKQILQSNELSVTQSRQAIYDALSKMKRPISINMLVAYPNDQVNRSTIYRSITIFERIGIVKKIHSGWKYRIELSDAFLPHHHHLTCQSCGKIIPLEEDKSLETSIDEIGDKYSFLITNHEVELTGLCKLCLKSHKSK